MPDGDDSARTPEQPARIRCRQLVELVTAYLDNVLDDDDRAAMARHLSICDNCAIYVQQFRETAAMLRRLEPDGLTTDAKERLLVQFRSWSAARPT